MRVCVLVYTVTFNVTADVRVSSCMHESQVYVWLERVDANDRCGFVNIVN